MMRQNIMAVGTCGAEDFHHMADRNQNANPGKSQGKREPPRHAQMTYFLQVGPTSYFLPLPNNNSNIL
jgi:hypothetical protein